MWCIERDDLNCWYSCERRLVGVCACVCEVRQFSVLAGLTDYSISVVAEEVG